MKNKTYNTLGGWHTVMAAINNPLRRIHALYATEKTLDAIKQAAAHRPDVLIQKVRQETLDGFWKEPVVHQGVAVEAYPLPDQHIEDIIPTIGEKAIVLILDQVQDPRNIGAICRSAAAFGVSAVIVQDKNSPQETESLAKAAAGALDIVPFIRAINIASTVEYLKKHGFWAVALDGKGDTPLQKIPSFDRIALIVGAEGKGIRPLVLKSADCTVHIPINPHMESLNVSNATAIALYQLTQS